MMMLRSVVAVLGLMLVGSVRAAECPLSKAVYAPIENDSFGKMTHFELTHGRKKLPANQGEFVVTIRASGDGPTGKVRSYDFAFAFTNGYGGIHLVYSGETARSANYKAPEGDDDNPGSLIKYFNEKLEEAEPFAEPERASPAFLIMPEIGQRFWYWQKGDRAFVPSGGMWRRSACRN